MEFSHSLPWSCWGSIHEVPKARPLPSQPRPLTAGNRPQEWASKQAPGPRLWCPAPGSSPGRWDRRWGPSKEPGQPDAGVQMPVLSAQGWRSPLELLPADKDSRSGLRPTFPRSVAEPRRQAGQQLTSSYLVLQ